MNEQLNKSDFKLGVVDEQSEDIVEFFRYFDRYFIPVKIEIGVNTEDAIRDIVDKSVDAVAIDYLLKEHNDTISYNGNDLFKEVNDQLKGYPCFLMTSYPDEAKKHNIDQFRVFSKSVMQPDPIKKVEFEKGLELVSRIKHAIQTYKKEIEDKEARILSILGQAEQRELNYAEEEELMELDSFFEVIQDQKHRIPKDFKSKTNDERLSKLLNKADEIIKRVDAKK